VVQPALWAVMVALAALWADHGVRPSAVVGHSQGEIAAACVAGALSIEDGARIVAVRSRLLRRLAGRGTMASLGVGEEAAAEHLRATPGVTVAAVNGPSSTVVSGPPDEVAAVVAACVMALTLFVAWDPVLAARLGSYPFEAPVADLSWYERTEDVPGGEGEELEVVDPADVGLDAAELGRAADWAEERASCALIVARRGRIALERYWGLGGRDVQTQSYSLAKTVLGLLVGLEIPNLSMNAYSLPRITALIRGLSVQRCRRLVSAALKLGDAVAIREKISTSLRRDGFSALLDR